MTEQQFLTALGRSARACGATWWWKIPDVGPAGGFGARRGAEAGDRVLFRRPFDAVAVAPGVFVAVEAKVVRPGMSLALRPHQEEALAAVASCGHAAWIVTLLTYRSGPSEVFAVPVQRFRRWKDEHGATGVPRQHVREVGVACPRVKGLWDVSVLFRGDAYAEV